VISGPPAAGNREVRGPPVPQLGHWTSSPNGHEGRGRRLTRRAGSQPWRKPPRNDRDATSASKTTACAGGSGKARLPGLGHERQERVTFLIGLERAVVQLADRGVWCAPGVPRIS
jgi:hypothetical protein